VTRCTVELPVTVCSFHIAERLLCNWSFGRQLFCNPPSLCAHLMVTTCGNITASTAGNDGLVASAEHALGGVRWIILIGTK